MIFILKLVWERPREVKWEFYVEVSVGATPGGQLRRIVWVLVYEKKRSKATKKQNPTVGEARTAALSRIERSTAEPKKKKE